MIEEIVVYYFIFSLELTMELSSSKPNTIWSKIKTVGLT